MKHVFNLDAKGIKKLAVWFVILSGIIELEVMLFNWKVATEFIDHPQFSYFHEYDQIKARISACGANFLYYAFFMLDLIWAPTLLLLIYNVAQQLLDGKRYLKSLLIFSVAAYAFDVLEGIGYIFGESLFGISLFSLSLFAKIKIALYVIVVFYLLNGVYQAYITDYIRPISRTLRASFLSILVIILILFLATKQEQGSTVIIHMLSSPFSIFVCSMTVFILALACAHYPDYMHKYLFPDNNKKVVWQRKEVGFFTSTLGMGIIHYVDAPPKDEADNALHKENTSQHVDDNIKNKEIEIEFKIGEIVRKNLGGALLLTWMFSLLHVLGKYVVFPVPVYLLFLFTILFYVYTFVKCYNDKHDPAVSDAPFEATAISSFSHLLISFLVTLLSCFFQDWILTCCLLMVTAFLNLRFYLYFQFFRSGFQLSKGKFQKIFSVGNIDQYLKVFAGMGWLALSIYLVFLFFPPALSALGFILIWMYVVYGVVVILLKHNLYYIKEGEKGESGDKHRMAPFFKSYIPILGFLVIGLLIYTGQAGNGLHVLPSKPETVSSIPMNTFVKDSVCKKYFLASYGGGLRATIWTMLLLNSDSLEVKDFLNSTAAMSGVSGGFLGLSFYTALMNEYDKDSDALREEAINRIGKRNMLSFDISYMLGPDLAREIFPYINCLGEDRALRSMREYADLIEGHSCENTPLKDDSYRTYWTKAYHKNGYMPALIGNTTGTHHKYGVAFSLSDVHLDSIFPGAENILDIKKPDCPSGIIDKCLTYLGATSTSERFPIFSPSAQVEGKGHFVDGGYFENSGLLSLKNFRDYYIGKTDRTCHDETDKIILIINSKDDYIRMVLDGLLIPKSDVPSGEFSAILSTVTDTDILPHAMEARLQKEFGDNRFIRIYLPYKITFDDVIRIIGDKPKYPFKILDVINASNKKIKVALGSGYSTHVYPALARVLSEPAYAYMKAMIHHEDVKKALAKI